MLSTRHSIIGMIIYLLAVSLIAIVLFIPLRDAFLANWAFNGLILGVLAIGILINFRQVLSLNAEINWIKLFRTGETGISLAEEPQLLKTLAHHLARRRKDRFRLSALSLKTILDGIRERLDESREVSRYIIGTLIFLGLLGTFWGLLQTVSAVAAVIEALGVEGRDFATVFGELKQGLMQPLSGMGTAFSSSLFGLGGSLLLGFLDLQASHAQNRFFNSLEEWLSGVTQLVEESGQSEAMELPGEMMGIDESGALEQLVEEIRMERRLLQSLLGEIRSGKQENDTP